MTDSLLVVDDDKVVPGATGHVENIDGIVAKSMEDGPLSTDPDVKATKEAVQQDLLEHRMPFGQAARQYYKALLWSAVFGFVSDCSAFSVGRRKSILGSAFEHPRAHMRICEVGNRTLADNIRKCLVMQAYDTQLTGSFYALPSFRKQFGRQVGKTTNYQLTPEWQTSLCEFPLPARA